MASEEVSGAIGGAAEGAKIGGTIGGHVGAVVGGILGGIAGLFGGSAKRKAKKYAKKANAEEERMNIRKMALERRNTIRELYLARAQAVAAGASESGGLASSTVQGAVSSIGSQGRFNLGFFDAQYETLKLRNKYAKKAGKYADKAADIGGLFNLAEGIGSLYDVYKNPAKGGISPADVGALSKSGTSYPTSKIITRIGG